MGMAQSKVSHTFLPLLRNNSLVHSPFWFPSNKHWHYIETHQLTKPFSSACRVVRPIVAFSSLTNIEEGEEDGHNHNSLHGEMLNECWDESGFQYLIYQDTSGNTTWHAFYSIAFCLLVLVTSLLPYCKCITVNTCQIINIVCNTLTIVMSFFFLQNT